ncbi:MAG TPA: T9SS type A sorting domain-containing protein, partial [Candidatus Krumholzibacteria bacterium]|nr:T9SS type A sorting domain-containing protein [Candidatus Krumholzibacteria bacterium]
PGDDGAVAVNLPFAFPMGGQSWTQMYVSGNGVVSFGAVANPSGYYDPADFYNGTAKIAGYYMDLDSPAGPPGGVFVKAEPSKTTITWYRVPAYGSANLNTFQVVLYPNGSFLLSYNGIASTLAGNPIVTGFNPGGSAALDVISFSSDIPHAGGVDAVYEEYFSYQNPVVNEIALFKRFYSRFPDQFFQLVYFTNFVQTMAGFANELTIKNDVAGLGQDTFDYSYNYGSQGALESRCNMNRLSVWNADPYARVFGKDNSFLSIMAQEAGHRWGAFLLFDNGTGKSNLLLGRANSHWSYYADMDHSSLEGGNWKPTGSSTFVCPTQVDYYSHLDEYLMGLRTPQEVKPVYYIKSATNDLFSNRSVGTPLQNSTSIGTLTPVPMDQIVRANGPRVPGEPSEGKDLRQAFILLLKAGTTPTQAELAKIAGMRRAWEAYFERSCDGRLTCNTSLSSNYSVAVVCGNVRDRTTGQPIWGFTANSQERNFYQQVPAGGRFTFRYQDDAARGTTEAATILFTAPGYRSATLQVAVPYGSTRCGDVLMTRNLVTTPVGEAPGTTELFANYPNPFNPSTTIRYRVASAGHVRLMVFDAAGRRIRVLVDDEQPAGAHDASFDGRDDAGRAIASGVYFYRLDAGGVSQTRKMVLLK